jgi:hypothetical protein
MKSTHPHCPINSPHKSVNSRFCLAYCLGNPHSRDNQRFSGICELY